VALPDAQTGYLAESSVEAIRKPVGESRAGAGPDLRLPDPAAAVMEEARNNQSWRPGNVRGYWLVQTATGKMGWYRAEPAITQSGS
jgi:hypothetical protein